MIGSFERYAAVSRLALLLTLVGMPATALAGSALALSYGDPPYTLAATCDRTQPLAVISVIVANHGSGTSAATSVSVSDADGVLSGEPQTLAPIAAGRATALHLPVRYVEGSAGPIAGAHAMTIVAGLERQRPLTVTIPAGLCAAPAPTLSVDRALPSPGASLAQRARVAATSSPVLTKVAQPAARLAQIADRPITVPINVRVASGAADCALHVGQIAGSLICPDMIRSGNVLLVWEWLPGTGPARVDGYRVYRVDGAKRLVDTRPSQDLKLTDLAVPAGGYPGTCYSVTAFAGARESAMSPPLCPTRAQTTIGAKPSVAPAPLHVVIHVTEDSYPDNTVVAAGGDVTWINDDTDAHTVYDGTYSNVIAGGGGRYTMVLRDVGRKTYAVAYNCQYHAGMAGTITVIRNP